MQRIKDVHSEADADQENCLLQEVPEGADQHQMKTVLIKRGVSPGRAYRLAGKPLLTPGLLRNVLKKADTQTGTINNHGGYIADVLVSDLSEAAQEEQQEYVKRLQARSDALAEAESKLDALCDEEVLALAARRAGEALASGRSTGGGILSTVELDVSARTNGAVLAAGDAD